MPTGASDDGGLPDAKGHVEEADASAVVAPDEPPVPVPRTDPPPSPRDAALLAALGDPIGRPILLLTNSEPRSAQELLRDLAVPQSTLYRKLHELREAGLLAIQRTVVTSDGRRVDLFRSLVSEADIQFRGTGVRVRSRQRDLAGERLADLWNDVRSSGGAR